MQPQLLVDLLTQTTELFDGEVWHGFRLAEQSLQDLLIGFFESARGQQRLQPGLLRRPKRFCRRKAHQALRTVQARDEKAVNVVTRGEKANGPQGLVAAKRWVSIFHHGLQGRQQGLNVCFRRMALMRSEERRVGKEGRS